MNILFVVDEIPTPDRNSADFRLSLLMSMLCEEHEVWVAVLGLERQAERLGAESLARTGVALLSREEERYRLLARNMPYYPGVPFTNFLHDGGNLNTGGYALHGAPWHRWSETVTRRETIRRYSAGCINLPNWERMVGNYTLPVDEFVFRWLGAFPNPAIDRHYISPDPDPVRIYSQTNIYQELFDYPAPNSVLYSGYNWGDVLELIDQRAVDAPDSFFEPTLL